MINKLILIIKNFYYKIIYKKPNVMNDEETLDYILKNNCSIARFGDGEMNIILGNNIVWFQDYSNTIRERLIDITKTNNEKLLLCIPKVIYEKKMDNYTNGAKNFWKKHRFFIGGFYSKHFSGRGIIGDTNISRFYLGRKNKNDLDGYINKIKKIWDKRNLLIVEGYNSKLGIDNDLLNNANSIRRIICPNKNAFDSYEKIILSVENNYKKDDLVLIALGPTATILAAELCLKYNIQSLDLGHIDIEYMWYINKSDSREIIKKKNTAEMISLDFDENDITPETIDIIK